MRKDTEDLLEHVLAAVMAAETDTLKLMIHLRRTVPDVRVMALIRALLAADQVIQETFNGHSPGRLDAARARAAAMTLAELADDAEDARGPDTVLPLRLGDLPI